VIRVHLRPEQGSGTHLEATSGHPSKALRRTATDVVSICTTSVGGVVCLSVVEKLNASAFVESVGTRPSLIRPLRVSANAFYLLLGVNRYARMATAEDMLPRSTR
jgi:uncharacterized protein (DUF849 family)